MAFGKPLLCCNSTPYLSDYHLVLRITPNFVISLKFVAIRYGMTIQLAWAIVVIRISTLIFA